MKKTFTPKEKAAIAFAALRGEKTYSEIASLFQVCTKQISRWKKTLQEAAPELFTNKCRQNEIEQAELIKELYSLLGQRDAELAWLKKKLHLFD